MQFKAKRDLVYMLNGSVNEETKIEAGTVLEAVDIRSLASKERVPLEKMVRREKRLNPNSRLVFFRWQGVVRGASAGKDLEVMLYRRKRRRR